jgi:peptidoglycan hydrolase-like protein with peptidoglycan-binding domain
MPQTISFGSAGADVSLAQDRLNSSPPSRLPELRVDGIFGAKTLTRVREFQVNRNLASDGVVGPKTWAQLLDSQLSLQDFEELGRLASSLLREIGGGPEQVGYFERHHAKIRAIATAGNAFNLIGFPIGGAGRPAPQALAAVGVAVVIVAAVIAAFVFACLLVMAQNSGANKAEQQRLARELDQAVSKIELEIATAGPRAIVLIAVMAVTLEQAVKRQIEALKREMDRCRLNNPLDPRCATKAQEIAKQMAHITQQVLLVKNLNPGIPEVKLLMIGIAKSFGFLMKLISDWGRCMGCKSLIFF